MDESALKHRLTAEERHWFEREGYLIVPNALDTERVQRLVDIIDSLYRKKLAQGLPGHALFVLRDFLAVDDALVDLVDNPRVFPKIWGILGFNIYVYHTHLGVTPPLGGRFVAPDADRYHQDNGRVNQELEGEPRARLSLKVAYFLEGHREPGNANLRLVPGSHIYNELPGRLDADGNPPGALQIGVAPGSAVIFDRRIWHSKSPNFGSGTRKVLFYGYAYRWLRTKDEMTVRHLYGNLDPIRRQLLGDGLSANGHYSPVAQDVPLLGWLQQHDPEALKCWLQPL